MQSKEKREKKKKKKEPGKYRKPLITPRYT